jgi:hypothetical protein
LGDASPGPAAFSASDAALEGFSLLRREWRTILAWAAFNLLALAMLVVVTVVLSVIAAALGAGLGASLAMAAAAIVGLGVGVIQVIIAAGVFRLEIRPQEAGFLRLRLGPDEFRLLVVCVITLTGAWTVLWAAMAAGGLAGVPPGWLMAAAIVLLTYLAARFSLAAPVSFVEKRVDFVRAWRLSRGRVLGLLGMQALTLSLIALIMATALLALALVAVGSAGLDGLASLFGGAESLKRHPGLGALTIGVQIVLTPVFWVLAMAPLTAAYRALAARPDGP